MYHLVNSHQLQSMNQHHLFGDRGAFLDHHTELIH